MQNEYCKEDTLFTAGQLQYLVTELIINAMTPNFFMNHVTFYQYIEDKNIEVFL